MITTLRTRLRPRGPFLEPPQRAALAARRPLDFVDDTPRVRPTTLHSSLPQLFPAATRPERAHA